MADIVTGTVSGLVDLHTITDGISDVRREAASETGDVRRDIQNSLFHASQETGTLRREMAVDTDRINDDIKNTGWKVSDIVKDQSEAVRNQATPQPGHCQSHDLTHWDT